MSLQAQQKVSMVMSGGPIYKKRIMMMPDLKASGFNTLVVWTMDIDVNGDMNLNQEFPLIKNGKYIGDKTWPHFQQDIASLKKGNSTIDRIEFSTMRDWSIIQSLVNTKGTGPDSALYKNFLALKLAFPDLDAISSNDEGHYDLDSTVKFAVMLADIGFKFTMSPYRKKEFWTQVTSQVNAQHPNTIDRIYVQGYDGGAKNNPCDWTLEGVEAYGSDWVARSSKPIIKNRMSAWKKQCNSPGGWLFLYDDFVGDAKSFGRIVNDAYQIKVGSSAE